MSQNVDPRFVETCVSALVLWSPCYMRSASRPLSVAVQAARTSPTHGLPSPRSRDLNVPSETSQGLAGALQGFPIAIHNLAIHSSTFQGLSRASPGVPGLAKTFEGLKRAFQHRPRAFEHLPRASKDGPSKTTALWRPTPSNGVPGPSKCYSGVSTGVPGHPKTFHGPPRLPKGSHGPSRTYQGRPTPSKQLPDLPKNDQHGQGRSRTFRDLPRAFQNLPTASSGLHRPSKTFQWRRIQTACPDLHKTFQGGGSKTFRGRDQDFPRTIQNLPHVFPHVSNNVPGPSKTFQGCQRPAGGVPEQSKGVQRLPQTCQDLPRAPDTFQSIVSRTFQGRPQPSKAVPVLSKGARSSQTGTKHYPRAPRVTIPRPCKRVAGASKGFRHCQKASRDAATIFQGFPRNLNPPSRSAAPPRAARQPSPEMITRVASVHRSERVRKGSVFQAFQASIQADC